MSSGGRPFTGWAGLLTTFLSFLREAQTLAAGSGPSRKRVLCPGRISCEPAWAPGVQSWLHPRATRVQRAYDLPGMS
jgi:hypothetical protein